MHIKAECKHLKEMYVNSLFSVLFSPEQRSKQHPKNSEKLLFQKMLCNSDFCLKLLIISKRKRNTFFTAANDDN